MEQKIFLVEYEPILVEQLKMNLEELGYWVVVHADNEDTVINRIISVQRMWLLWILITMVSEQELRLDWA
jgi:DNA-binding response OmpR family regulator